ncbi:MAG TPA: hypothetical protein VFC16_18615, partial [Nakamurella sp.]|nr:hypothetical protein [Nakamurella sp.]
MSNTHLRRGRGGLSRRPLRARLLVGLTGLALVGSGSLLSGPLAPPALADEPPPCGQAPTSPRPTFFTDEAGQPPVAAPDRPNHYTLTAHLGTHSFHSGWPAVPTLGYSSTGSSSTG